MRITFIDNGTGTPAGKLADCELHFDTGDFAGLKLIGFAIWERRNSQDLNVTFPSRQYSVNGERRSFALLRATGGDIDGTKSLRDAIVQAYQDHRLTTEAIGV